MSIADFTPHPIEEWGGLVTLPDASDLAPWMSPDCQNCEFAPGKVSSRPGFTRFLTILGTDKINSIAKYVEPGLLHRLLVFTSTGKLYEENPAETLTLIKSGLIANSYFESDTLFGRQYLALWNAQVGGDLPMQYDDNNVRRVAPEGPGAGPSMADESQVGYETGQDADQELTGAATGDVGQSFQITVDSDIHYLEVWMKKLGTPAGQMTVQIETDSGGVPSGTIVGAASEAVAATKPDVAYGWVKFSFVDPIEVTAATTYWIVLEGDATYDAAYSAGVTAAVWGIDAVGAYADGNLATWAPSTWTAQAAKDGLFRLTTGLISEGKHKVICWFETDTGHWTKCSPPVNWTAAGNRRVNLTSIPTGPANVKRRLVACTEAAGESYYHLPTKMVVDDNTSTTLTVDFTDVGLLEGENVDYLFRLLALPPQVGVARYYNRLIWWSGTAIQNGWKNLGFDGGFASGGEPLGWSQGSNFAGGAKETTKVMFGESWKITGDGATAARGEIKHGAVTEPWGGQPLIRANTEYLVRARVKKNGTLSAGTLNIDLVGTGIDTTGLVLAHSAVTTDWVVYEATLTSGLTSIPSDLELRVFADGTPNSGGIFYVEELEVVRSDFKWDASVARVSKPNAPESYDGTEGLIEVSPDDGQPIRVGFQLRRHFYFVKERSTYVTTDDGRNEAIRWPVELVSSEIGTNAPKGVGHGEDWVVICSYQGLYLFDGSTPRKISQEIQPTWDNINWSSGASIWCDVDTLRKEIYIGVPTGAYSTNQLPDTTLVLNYQDGFENPIENKGRGRKWDIWTGGAVGNTGAVVRRRDNPVPSLMVGNGSGNGKILELGGSASTHPDQRADDGSLIDSYYRTGSVGASTGRYLFGYLTGYAYGSGSLAILFYKPDGTTVTVPAHTLANPAAKDLEQYLEVIAERASVRFRVSTLNEWFTLTKATLYAKPHPIHMVS